MNAWAEHMRKENTMLVHRAQMGQESGLKDFLFTMLFFNENSFFINDILLQS